MKNSGRELQRALKASDYILLCHLYFTRIRHKTKRIANKNSENNLAKNSGAMHSREPFVNDITKDTKIKPGTHW